MKTIECCGRENRDKLEGYAGRMRARPTAAEDAAYAVLKLLAPKGLHGVHRQRPICLWVIDFVLPDYDLLVEIDGGYHDDPEQKAKDAYRDATLRGLGFDVLRVENWSLAELAEAISCRLPSRFAEYQEAGKRAKKWLKRFIRNNRIAAEPPLPVDVPLTTAEEGLP